MDKNDMKSTAWNYSKLKLSSLVRVMDALEFPPLSAEAFASDEAKIRNVVTLVTSEAKWRVSGMQSGTGMGLARLTVSARRARMAQMLRLQNVSAGTSNRFAYCKSRTIFTLAVRNMDRGTGAMHGTPDVGKPECTPPVTR